MKSLHILSRVLPLTLLMSVPVYLTGQKATPIDIGTMHETEMHPGQKEMPMEHAKELLSGGEVVKHEPQPPTGVDFHKHVKEIKNKEDLKKALKSHKNVVVKVSTKWCGACKMAEEPFAKAVKLHKDNVKAYHLDADNPAFKDFIEMFKVPGYPTFLFIRTEVGARDAKEFGKSLADLTGNTRIIQELESGRFEGDIMPFPRRRRERRARPMLADRPFMQEEDEGPEPEMRRPRRIRGY